MKFDTGAIENFETLSADELRSILTGLDVPSTDELKQLKNELQKKSNAFDKTSSELAEAKRTIRANQSAEEIAKAEREAADKELREKYEALLKENAIAKDAARFTALGVEAEMATAMATAIADGDKDSLFTHLTSFKTGLEKSIRADITRNAPKPDAAGSGSKTITKAEIMAIRDSAERQQAIGEHPELFTNNKGE